MRLSLKQCDQHPTTVHTLYEVKILVEDTQVKL